jgi:hypothetical protein
MSMRKKMKRRTKSLLFQLPLIVLVMLSFAGSLVAKIGGLYPLSWGTPITLALILGLYFWGRKLELDMNPYR